MSTDLAPIVSLAVQFFLFSKQFVHDEHVCFCLRLLDWSANVVLVVVNVDLIEMCGVHEAGETAQGQCDVFTSAFAALRF